MASYSERTTSHANTSSDEEENPLAHSAMTSGRFIPILPRPSVVQATSSHLTTSSLTPLSSGADSGSAEPPTSYLSALGMAYRAPPFVPTVKIMRDRLLFLSKKQYAEDEELESVKLWEEEIKYWATNNLQHFKAVARYSSRCFKLVEAIDDQLQKGVSKVSRSKELSQTPFIGFYNKTEPQKFKLLQQLYNQELKFKDIRKSLPTKRTEASSSTVDVEQDELTLRQENKRLQEHIATLKANVEELQDKLVAAAQENKGLKDQMKEEDKEHKKKFRSIENELEVTKEELNRLKNEAIEVLTSTVTKHGSGSGERKRRQTEALSTPVKEKVNRLQRHGDGNVGDIDNDENAYSDESEKNEDLSFAGDDFDYVNLDYDEDVDGNDEDDNSGAEDDDGEKESDEEEEDEEEGEQEGKDEKDKKKKKNIESEGGVVKIQTTTLSRLREEMLAKDQHQKEVDEYDKEEAPRKGQYYAVRLEVDHWKGPKTHRVFVAQVLGNDLGSQEVQLNFPRQLGFLGDVYHFMWPEKQDKSWEPMTNIMCKMSPPEIDRRGKLLFKKKELDEIRRKYTPA